MNEFIRSFDAAVTEINAPVDDVNKKDRTIVARINARTLDRFNSVIDPRGADFADYLKNRVVLWEHGRDQRRGTDPIGKNLWIRTDGGERPTAILAKTKFLPDDFSQQRFEWYREGVLNAFSIRAIPRDYGPPTKDEIRDWPELDNGRPNETRGAFDGALMYRKWDLAEYSGTSVPGNADCLVTERATAMLDLVRRDLLWLPDDVRELVAERASHSDSVVVAEEDEEVPEAVESAPAVVERRIVKKGGKYYVYSEDGAKKLGGPYGTRQAAAKRLQQIEYFKHKDKSDERSAPQPPVVVIEGKSIVLIARELADERRAMQRSVRDEVMGMIELLVFGRV